MKTEYIELLKKRIARLAEKDFDLESWKSGTTILLSRIFGKNNSYSNEIDDLNVDYSSWALRDATSNYNPKETCKRSGNEILELAIAELQLPQNKEKSKYSITATLQDKSGKLDEAIANKDEHTILKLLNRENKDDLTKLLAKLLAE